MPNFSKHRYSLSFPCPGPQRGLNHDYGICIRIMLELTLFILLSLFSLFMGNCAVGKSWGTYFNVSWSWAFTMMVNSSFNNLWELHSKQWRKKQVLSCLHLENPLVWALLWEVMKTLYARKVCFLGKKSLESKSSGSKATCTLIHSFNSKVGTLWPSG